MKEQRFSVHEAASLLDLTPSQVRAFARAGLESAKSDLDDFGFRDLVVLRMAAGLRRAEVPSRRITHALKRLRTTDAGKVAGLQLEALGDHVVVRDGEVVWRADSGQFDLGLGATAPHPAEPRPVSLDAAPVAVLAPSGPETTTAEPDAYGCLQKARELEPHDPEGAVEWYRLAVDRDPEHWEARASLGFAFQQTGKIEEAVEAYQAALSLGTDATVAFNLGVALEDLSREEEARAAYRQAIDMEPGMGDAHFNLSCLLEKSGDRPGAIRHMIAYRENASD